MGKRTLDESMASEASAGDLGAPTTEKEEYENLCVLVNAIAQPLANRKLAKKVYKLIKKASKTKGQLRQGIADVQKAIRKKETGIVILAGNVTPIDVYSHMPALCEDKEYPYCFTPSREHLGLAAGHRRPSVIMLIRPGDDYQELFDEVKEALGLLVIDEEFYAKLQIKREALEIKQEVE